ncbi:hypothetical protein P7K49_032508 [Saguinus oedipus]|uniref:Uncharacterized protein n=1 Tax=Saguinus oedipus TaxID=9490 RepID=A0ABQ9U0C1_SAGOE|nr:hypothetical protein P7K49_032508 [Saguinus oedipus]
MNKSVVLTAAAPALQLEDSETLTEEDGVRMDGTGSPRQCRDSVTDTTAWPGLQGGVLRSRQTPEPPVAAGRGSPAARRPLVPCGEVECRAWLCDLRLKSETSTDLEDVASQGSCSEGKTSHRDERGSAEVKATALPSVYSTVKNLQNTHHTLFKKQEKQAFNVLQEVLQQ